MAAGIVLVIKKGLFKALATYTVAKALTSLRELI